METAKIVIGANFGDEGKGLMTDYFAYEAKKQGKPCLVVCHNGGSQRGHTVVSTTGVRHVFHHFGAGMFAGADTYLSEEFIVNPIIFNKEWAELGELGGHFVGEGNAKEDSAIEDNTKKANVNKNSADEASAEKASADKRFAGICFVNGNCLVTTPFDMMLNQLAEECRGKDKHGSCGLGIFETIVRSRTYLRLTVGGLAKMSADEIAQILKKIATEYFPYRLKELGIDRLPFKWVEILSCRDSIIENYICDFYAMLDNMEIADDGIIDDYPYVIFEGAQGLLLDQSNTAYMPHLTPSNTGLKNPQKIIGTRKADIEVCYVSRTYMTRHGAGRFDTECPKSDINADIVDMTNVPNPYQDSLRYGALDLADLKRRIDKDLSVDGGKYKKSIALTHLNEYPIAADRLAEMFGDFCIYLSDGMAREAVIKLLR